MLASIANLFKRKPKVPLISEDDWDQRQAKLIAARASKPLTKYKHFDTDDTFLAHEMAVEDGVVQFFVWTEEGIRLIAAVTSFGAFIIVDEEAKDA